MNAIPEQAWRCLRGHENEPDRRSCEVCHLPRWLNRYTLSIAGVALLLGLLYGGYSLSQSLKKWQYQSVVQQAWTDRAISPQERQELEAQKTYLGVSDEQARQWEAAITGAVLEPPPDGGRPLLSEGKTLTADLQGIREALEQGRLSEAREAITALSAQYPQEAGVSRLKQDIEQGIHAHIELRVLGEASGRTISEAKEEVVVMLTGTETSYRFYVAPREAVYFYLYEVDHGEVTQGLLPSDHQHSPLFAGTPYWFPSEFPEHGYPLQGKEEKVIYLVASRWPARELEKWSVALAGKGEKEAGRALHQALEDRQKAQLGGCDVITVKFAGRGGGT